MINIPKIFRDEDKCCNGGHKHKFEARYDEKFNDELGSFKTVGSATAEQMRKLLYYDVYLFDICKWCGEKIKRED